MSGRVGLEVGTGLAGRRVLILVCYHIEAGIPKARSFLFSDTGASSGVGRKIACVLRSVFAESGRVSRVGTGLLVIFLESSSRPLRVQKEVGTSDCCHTTGGGIAWGGMGWGNGGLGRAVVGSGSGRVGSCSGRGRLELDRAPSGRAVSESRSGLSGRDRTPGCFPGIVLPPFKGAEGSWNK